jgi:hypothetical protein
VHVWVENYQPMTFYHRINASVDRRSCGMAVLSGVAISSGEALAMADAPCPTCFRARVPHPAGCAA